MKTPFRASLSLCLAGLAAPTSAQDFNVDVGQTISTNPTSAYGGGAGQPGYWTWIQPIPGSTQGLLGLTGAGTPVTVRIEGGVGGFAFDHPGTSGDDERLMDDLLDLGGPGSQVTWRFQSLDAGGYWVYTYAWAPDNAAFTTRVHVDGAIDPDQLVSGAWPGAQRYMKTFALHFVVLSPGEDLVVKTTAAAGNGSVNGFQLVTGGCDGRVHAYCAGKVNSAGCLPEIGSAGVPSVGAGGGFHVLASNVPPNKPGFLIYGLTGAAELPFFNGLLCMNGPYHRTPVQLSGPGGACGGHYDLDFNAFAHLPGADPALLIPGTSVWAQYYYRDQTHPDGTGVGVTDALRFTMCF